MRAPTAPCPEICSNISLEFMCGMIPFKANGRLYHTEFENVIKRYNNSAKRYWETQVLEERIFFGECGS